MTRRFDTGCTVEVSHRFEELGAHVRLDGGVAIGPGDRVLVHGPAIRVPFGETRAERRIATVTRAGAIGRFLARQAGWRLNELYEVGFDEAFDGGHA